MLKLFTGKRRDVAAPSLFEDVGDLRFSAKRITGAGVVEPIPGLLYCNGVAVSQATYKRLFDLIGTTYNVGGESAGTFRLPDFRGRFLAGYTDGLASGVRITGLLLGGILGAEAISLAKANLPPHQHGVGTLAIGSGGGHSHTHNFTAITSIEQSNDVGWWRGDGTQSYKAFDGGGLIATTHTHSLDAGTTTGNASADGAAATAHQNVHPHQAVGGILVAY